MLIERWNDVKDNPKYEVSNTGRVRNKKTERILSQSLNRPNGYLRVGIDGKHYYVHRLVADSFYDGDHTNMDVNHRDGNRTNNELSNLEWVTRKYNIDHAYRYGLKLPTFAKIIPCKFCRHRGEYGICDGQADEFYCAHGER